MAGLDCRRAVRFEDKGQALSLAPLDDWIPILIVIGVSMILATKRA